MNIRTIGQVNALDCCNCDFPTCGVPRKECKSIIGTLTPVGFFDEDDLTWKIYDTESTTDSFLWSFSEGTESDPYTGSGSGFRSIKLVYSELYEGNLSTGGDCKTWESEIVQTCESEANFERSSNNYEETITRIRVPGEDQCLFVDNYTYTDYLVDPPEVTSYDIGDGWSFGAYGNPVGSSNQVNGVVTYENGITYSAWVTQAKAAIEAEIAIADDECWSGLECISYFVNGSSDGDSITVEKSKYRFAPPEEYDRSTWEMEWDLVTASPEWWEWYDAGATGTEPSPGPSLVSHEAWVWDGIEEWSEWFEIPIPTETGETRVVNVQTVCWKSTRIGTKPFLSGDEVALPE